MPVFSINTKLSKLAISDYTNSDNRPQSLLNYIDTKCQKDGPQRNKNTLTPPTSLSAFKDYLSQRCPTINQFLAEESMVAIFMTMAAWIWIIFSCYERIEFSGVLQGNSSNAKFTLLKRIQGDIKEDVFVKIQLNPDSDDMIMDNINGQIMNYISGKHGIEKHVMKYYDSCWSFTKVGSINANGKKYQIFPLQEIMVVEGQQNIMENPSAYRHFHKFSFHRAIPTEMNLGAYIDVTDPFSPTEMSNLLLKLHKLLSVIKLMGTTYGFCHNDAHLGNVLLSSETDELVLIDYGRCCFAEELPAFKDFRHQLEEIVEFEMLKNDPEQIARYCTRQKQRITNTPYRTVINDPNHKGSIGVKSLLEEFTGVRLTDGNAIEPMFYLFDIMTLTLCVLKKLFIVTYPEKQKFFSFKKRPSDTVPEYVKEVFSFSKDLNLMYVREPFAVLQHMKSLRQDDPWSFLYVGIYWLSFFAQYLHTLEAGYTENVVLKGKNWFVLDRSLLNKNGIIYHYFQLIGIPTPNSVNGHLRSHPPPPLDFMFRCNDAREDIQLVQSFIKDFSTFSSVGGGKAKKLKAKYHKSNSTRTTSHTNRKQTNMKVEQVDPSVFSHLMGGYKMEEKYTGIAGGQSGEKESTSMTMKERKAIVEKAKKELMELLQLQSEKRGA
jgi:Choline/ethanolamine kinase